MAFPANRVRGTNTACDRCYRLKERCERASTIASCERCERLGHTSLTARPVRPVGRRANHSRLSIAPKISNRSRPHTQSVDFIGSWIRDAPNSSPEEKELLVFLLGNSQTQYPVVSPRFQCAEQKSFAGPLPAAWPILKDAYLAYACVLRSLEPGEDTEADDASKVRYATLAMAALRSLPIANPKDAELCLTLGFALALSVYGAIGVGVSDICHYCLSIARPFVEAAAVSPEMEHRISVLVLLETMECVVYRRTPTLKMQPRRFGLYRSHSSARSF